MRRQRRRSARKGQLDRPKELHKQRSVDEADGAQEAQLVGLAEKQRELAPVESRAKEAQEAAEETEPKARLKHKSIAKQLTSMLRASRFARMRSKSAATEASELSRAEPDTNDSMELQEAGGHLGQPMTQLDSDELTPSTRATMEAVRQEIMRTRLETASTAASQSYEPRPREAVTRSARALRTVFKKQQTFPGASSPSIAGQDNVLQAVQQQQQQQQQRAGLQASETADLGAGPSTGSAARRATTNLINRVKQPLRELGSNFNMSPATTNQPSADQPLASTSRAALHQFNRSTSLATSGPGESKAPVAPSTSSVTRPREQLAKIKMVRSASGGARMQHFRESPMDVRGGGGGGGAAKSCEATTAQPNTSAGPRLKPILLNKQQQQQQPRQTKPAKRPPVTQVAAPSSLDRGQTSSRLPGEEDPLVQSSMLAKLVHHRTNIDITSLSFIPNAKEYQYLGALSFSFIRETNSVRENGGLNGFVHCFLMEIYAIVRAHVAALGGNAFISFKLQHSAIFYHPNKNQAQCLISVTGDACLVAP